MKKSYSKIRHIQEANERIEENYLQEQGVFNTVRAGVAGAAQNIGTRAQNLGNALKSKGQKKIPKNPKLEAVVKKLKIREDYLNKQLNFLKQELEEYKQELSNASTATPDYKPEFDKTISVIDGYITSIDNTLAQGQSLQSYSVTYTA
jgi:chromosome segregation ATPase